MEKGNEANQKTLDQALADGTIVGYGNDETLVHEADGGTHDSWWSAKSMAGLIHVLEQFYANNSATSPVLASATKHWDEIYVSRYYNWHPGSWKNSYTQVAIYRLKPDAPNNALDMLSSHLIAPLMEKMLADGAIHEYEIDAQAIHTQAPGMFLIIYLAANPEGLDKVTAAIQDTLKSHPLDGPAFGSMVDFTAHRDVLLRTSASYK